MSIKLPDSGGEGAAATTKKFQFDLKTAGRVFPLAAEKSEDMFTWLHALRRAALYYSKLDKDKKNADEVKAKAVDKVRCSSAVCLYFAGSMSFAESCAFLLCR